MPRTYRLIITVLRFITRLYFRRVEVSGLEHVPTEGGGVLVAWHPNGLVDPGLILTQFPRQVIFGARHGLFGVPVLGQLMKSIGTVPIYRVQDASDDDSASRQTANRGSLDALVAEVARGSFSCLFPEGTSHDSPHPLEIKTGAARLYYLARKQASADQVPPVIIPVGLHYDKKRLFRSRALVQFHPPMPIPAHLDVAPPADEDTQTRRARYRALTDEIDRALHETAHATETWELHHLMRRTRKLVRAERAVDSGRGRSKPDMKELTLGFSRVRHAYNQRLVERPEHVAEITERVREYDANLRALKLDDDDLDASPRVAPPLLVLSLIGQVIAVYLLVPPLLALGFLVNAPGIVAVLALTKTVSKYKKDEATVKLLAGALVFPVLWLIAGAVVWYLHHRLNLMFPQLPDVPWMSALAVILLAALGGFLALRYTEISRETARALRIRFTRFNQRETLKQLRGDRRQIFDDMMALAEGLDLPGQVDEAGRLSPNLPGATL